MGGLFKDSPSPPPAPDYAGAAVAQGAANKETAIASSLLNNPNVNSVYGKQTWEGGTDGSRPTLTQTLSPEQQSLYMKQLASKGLLADLGTQGAGALKGVVGTGVDFSGAPAAPTAYTNNSAMPQASEAIRRRVIDASMGRANEDYAKQTDQSNSDLIAAGIRPGSKAYADRQQMIERSRNDARNQAELAGGAAANQAYQQDLTTRQQQNSEGQQRFAQGTDARRQYITELLAQRQTPLNEINALMSGSQVSNPFAVPGAAQNSNIAPAPIFGATQQQGQYDTGVYNAQQGAQNSAMNGLFQLGAAALPTMLSDRRLKSNIVRIGTHPLGIGIYEYDIFGKRDVGVMAQEVLEVMPSAIVHRSDGYMMVDYGRL